MEAKSPPAGPGAAEPAAYRGHSELLVGRRVECASIDALLVGAREGRSATQVIRGDPGLGKTTLLRYARDRAAGMRVLTVTATEPESRLPFAGLSAIAQPVLARLDAIPTPQREAMAAALALAPPAPPEPFAVAAATLSLLAAAAEEQPVVCLVDDAHWLDRPSADALAFAARRLNAEGVVLLIAIRAGERVDAFDRAGLPEMLLAPLNPREAAALLGQLAPDLAPTIARRLINDAAGNPLALTQMLATLTPAQRKGEEGLQRHLPVGELIRESYSRELQSLPPDGRTALLVVALSESPSMTIVADALHNLGLTPEALEGPEATGLINIADREVRFTHPLVRSVVVDLATGNERRSAHRALAGAYENRQLNDRRAWHLAEAALMADEAIARCLEEAADEARRRAAHASAATTFARAAELSPEPEPSAQRYAAAARAAQIAGRDEQALRYARAALAASSDPLLRADVQISVAVAQVHDGQVWEAHNLLVAEAGRIEELDALRAGELLAMAAAPAIMAGDCRRALNVARRAYALTKGGEGFSAQAAALAYATALILTGEAAEGAPLLRKSIPRPAFSPAAARQLLWQYPQPLVWIEEYELARTLIERVIDEARSAGAAALLPFTLAVRSEMELRTGRWVEARADAWESTRLSEELGLIGDQALGLACLALVESGCGQEANCRAHVQRAAELVRSRAFGSLETYLARALGLLELGRGRAEEAIAHLEPLVALTQEHGLGEPATVQWAPDLIEAYVRVGRDADAQEVLTAFERQARHTNRTWALAAAARCRGLLAGDAHDADLAFEEALRLHARSTTPFERARTELCWGERLRRGNRRGEARSRLRSALTAFEQLQAAPWAARARAELKVSGERVVPSQDHLSIALLTPQELQIALTIAHGATNREAAAGLFLSEKTIEYHLTRVYRKLGLRSRSDLARYLATQPDLDSDQHEGG